jgi:flavodoxin
MARVLIASFSQTGSTKKVADLIAKGLHSSDRLLFLLRMAHIPVIVETGYEKPY